MNHRIAVSVVALLLAVAPFAVAGDEHDHGKEEMTVRGEIVDLACYIAHEAKGEGHAKCAQQCAKSGQPIGLLSAKGELYLLYASHEASAPFAKAKEHAGQQVNLKGVATSRGGIQALEVHDVTPI